MRFLLKIFLSLVLFLVLAAPAKAQYIGNCSENKEIKKDPNGWLYKQEGFKPPEPPPPYELYNPYIKKNYTANEHRDTSMLPNDEALACLIVYAKEEWNDNMGTGFDNKGVTKVIDFALSHQYNPSLLLALWSEESHGGDQSQIELGCGQAYGLDAQLQCLATQLKPEVLNNNFACFMGGYAGDTPSSLNCGYGDPDGIITNPDFWVVMQFYNYLTQGVTSNPPPPTPTAPPTNFDFHPLRPNPGEPQPLPSPSPDTFLTTYCAMRPTAVEQNRFDKRDEFIDPQTVGTMTQDFTKFITPLLSITDPTKPDYSLPFTDKAQRYLADYLEGRAYYEPQAEPANPTPTQQADLFNRLGVIRKLLPMSQQDKLKRALIQRGAGIFDPGPTASSSAYGFTPASVKVHDYIVGYWGKGSKAVTLSDFVDHWAPLPENYPDGGYAEAYEDWKNSDGGKWYSLWPYVPMFSREDSPGKIEIFDSNPPPAPECPGCSFAEENTKSDKKTVEVSHPHLARTYEVSTTLSYLLTPQAVHDSSIPVEEWNGNPQTPPQTALHDEWTPKMWDMSDWWLNPDAAHFKPHPTPLNSETFTYVILGPLCDLDPKYNEVVYSSGDPAYDSVISTSVKRIDHGLPNPQYDPTKYFDSCVDDQGNTITKELYTCEKFKNNCNIDASACFYYEEVRSNPTYFQTQTPFLVQILNSTMLSGRGIFDLFKPFSAVKKDYEENDWPGLGNEGEESPVYDYTANSGEQARAEAGTMKPGDSQGYYYRFLGDIQCAKERTMQVLQPFITGEAYKPFAGNCFPELAPPPGPPGILPTGSKWLQWPTKNHAPARTSQCFGAPGDHPHAGLDFVAEPDDGAPIYPGAVGTVVRVDHDTVNENGGFGYFVIIRHDNGYSTIYSHLYPDIRVHEGQTVGLDTQLGRQDTTGNSTGNHVHFGLAKGSALSDFYWSGPIEDPCAAMQNCSCSQ